MYEIAEIYYDPKIDILQKEILMLGSRKKSSQSPQKNYYISLDIFISYFLLHLLTTTRRTRRTYPKEEHFCVWFEKP